MNKICLLHTACAVGILEKVDPKMQLSKGPNKQNCMGSQWDESELRSSKSSAVPPTTPFACCHKPLLGTVLSTLSEEWVMRRQDVVKPCLREK